jgi:hypothetical protein
MAVALGGRVAEEIIYGEDEVRWSDCCTAAAGACRRRFTLRL